MYEKILQSTSKYQDDVTPLRNAIKRSTCKDKCSFVSLYQEKSAQSPIISIKELLQRIFGGLKGFHELMKARKQQVKIIHLLRDPRSWWYSRYKISNNSEENIHDHCKRNLVDLKYGLKNLNKENYYVVRYEDILQNFRMKVNEIMHFANMKTYPEYEEFLKLLEFGEYVN